MAHAYASRGTSWVRLQGIGAFAFDKEGDEVTAIPDLGMTKEVVAEAYRRAVLPMIQQARSHQVLHASAVRASGGVVAFCGSSGAGKSTMAYGFARRGYPVWGDDALCFDVSDSGIDTIPLPFDLLLRPSVASFFALSADAARITRGQEESEPSSATAPLSALCVLRGRSSGVSACPPVKVARLPSSDAFTATLAHAYALGLGERDQRKRLVEEYLRLAATAPVYEVDFERDLDQLGAVVELIEERLGLEPPSA